MLAELIEKIRGLSVTAAKPEVIKVEGIDDRVFLKTATELRDVALPAPRRNHEIRSLADFVAALLDKKIAPAPEVFFDDKGAKAVLDRETRRDQIALPVVFSERWIEILRLDEGLAMNAKDAVTYLRHNLHGDEVADLLNGIRRIQFNRSSTGVRTTEHGKESLGRSVEAAVQSADKIPEYFTVTAFPAINAGLRGIAVTVRIAVTIDFDKEQILLRAIGDEVENAKYIFAQTLGGLLRAAIGEVDRTIPIFDGEF